MRKEKWKEPAEEDQKYNKIRNLVGAMGSEVGSGTILKSGFASLSVQLSEC